MFFSNITINENIIGNIPPLTSQQTKIILSQLEKAVCKIYNSKTSIATGFLLKIPNPDQFSLLPVLITTNHFLKIEDIKKKKDITITFDNDKIVKNINLNEERLIYCNCDKDIDISILEIKPQKEGLNNYLDIDENIFEDNYEITYQNKPIYILQYPNGRESSHSLGLVNSIIGTNIQHSCSTDFGSSGSPILNLSNFKVIGVHKGGTSFNMNKGTFIKFIIERFNEECSKKKDNDKGSYNINKIQNTMPIMNYIPNNMGNLIQNQFHDFMLSDNDIWIKAYTEINDKNNINIDGEKKNLLFSSSGGNNYNLVFN